MVEIICIHLTNRYGNDVGIKYSRFNHSCSPNAYNGEKEIRAFQKIKAGEEISVTYKIELAMKNLVTRQESLHKHYGFTCCCELCHKEGFNNDEETYEKYHRLEVNKQNFMLGSKADQIHLVLNKTLTDDTSVKLAQIKTFLCLIQFC